MYISPPLCNMFVFLLVLCLLIGNEIGGKISTYCTVTHHARP